MARVGNGAGNNDVDEVSEFIHLRLHRYGSEGGEGYWATLRIYQYYTAVFAVAPLGIHH